MDEAKRERLEAAGYAVGGYADFLGLADHERLLIEFRAAIAEAVRDARSRAGLTQATLAERIESDQSRVDRIESADPDVSLDLMLLALFAAGGTLADVAEASRTATDSDRAFHATGATLVAIGTVGSRPPTPSA